MEGFFIIVAGLFSIAGALFDWDWFMYNRRARPFVKLLGRGGARVFYAMLGLIFVGIGVAVLTGVLA